MEAQLQRMQQSMTDAREAQQQENQALRGFIQHLQDRERALTTSLEHLMSQHNELHRSTNQAQQSVTDTNIRLAEAEVRMRSEIDGPRGRGQGGGRAQSLVDTKHMRPGSFGSKDDGPDEYKIWSIKLIRFTGNVDEKFRTALRAAAARKGAVEQIGRDLLGRGDFAITQEQDTQLQSLLVDTCVGRAFSLINVVEKEQGTGLEMWRRLENEYNADTMNRTLIQGRRLLNPGTGKTWAEVGKILLDWDSALSEKRLRDGADGIDDEMKLSILYGMIPPEKARAIWENGQYRTVETMRHHMEDMIRNLTGGVAPMNIGNMESDTMEFTDEHGELCRLERDSRGGWKKPQGRRFQGPGQGSGRDASGARTCHECGKTGHVKANCPQVEGIPCKRCGRKGHVDKKCWATFHIDKTKIAGAPPAPRPERGVGSLETDEADSEEIGNLETIDLGDLIDVCALEVIEEDPWEEKDPWGAAASTLGCSDACRRFELPTATPVDDPLVCQLCVAVGIKIVLPRGKEADRCEVLAAPRGLQGLGRGNVAVPAFAQVALAPNESLDVDKQEVAQSKSQKKRMKEKYQIYRKKVKKEIRRQGLEEMEIPASPLMDPSSTLSQMIQEAGIPAHGEDEFDEHQDVDFDGHNDVVNDADVGGGGLGWVASISGYVLILLTLFCPILWKWGRSKKRRSTENQWTDLMTIGNAMEVDAVGDNGRMDVTVDSGAGESVANHRSMPQYPLQPSAGSKRGQKYRGPGGEIIPNEGQQRIGVKLESGDVRAMTFQAAPVRKPLLAVSGACDKNQFVIFDNDGSFICQRSSEEAKQILKLLKKIPKEDKIALASKNGTYTMPVWLQPFPAGQGK